ncbi:hypothetical protein DICVIV_04435 [Dictyocaulus viviparus]|uniref:SAM domain-containing protein n=1 Tax=Dictyocaulus viviparus TaxID=29172 RepID=A0A0D8XY45_DICVI|nr:hypothetical protein DICVIV_04435 [Dictyocaulus viviparus]
MSDEGPPKLASNVTTSSQETRTQQTRTASSSAGLRNLAPRQQCMTNDMMRMVGSIPQGTLPRQIQTQHQSAAIRNSQGTPHMVQLHQVQQLPVAGRVITMNSMQAPQQLIPVPMRMVSNGTSINDGQPAPNPNEASNAHNVTSQQAAMVDTTPFVLFLNALRPGNAALMVVQGPNGPMVLNTSSMHPGLIPQNLVQVQIAQGIQGMHTMQTVQRQQQQQQMQQHVKTIASRSKKRHPESGSGEMSVGEYLALGMDEKGRAESGSCGTDSPDNSADVPPALDRGDSIEISSPQPANDSTKSLDAIFIREALAFRARGGGCGKPLVHYMDGFTIEESDVPFPLTQYNKITEIVSSDVLDDIMPLIADIDVKQTSEEKSTRRKVSPQAKSTALVETENDNKRKLPRTRRSVAVNQNDKELIRGKKEEVDNVNEDLVKAVKHAKNRRQASFAHPPRRRTNELELLLNMDFGPKDAGRRILDTEKRKSVLEKEKRTSLETGDEKEDHVEKTRTRQKRRSAQLTTPESPHKTERVRASVDPIDRSRKSTGKHEKSKDKEASSQITPSVSMRILPHVEYSPEDCCLYCQVSFKEKERCVSTPQYCSTKCRRSYQSMIATESMKRVSGGSEGAISSTSNDVRSKVDEDTSLSSSKTKRREESSPSKKVDSSQSVTPTTSNAPISPLTVKLETPVQRSTINSPTNADHSPAAESAGIMTPVSVSCGPLNVPGVDYDVDPKLWTPDVAARWAQAVTGSETCAATFRREEVDGDAMLMMGFDDLRSHLSFTFGPAKKLQLAIEQLKVFRDQKYGTP